MEERPAIFTEKTTYVKRTLSTFVMIASLVGLSILGWFAVEEGRNPPELSEIPIIRADKKPFKVQPKDPGGMVIPHQEKKVFDSISVERKKDEEEKAKKSANILPPPEEPITKKALLEQNDNQQPISPEIKQIDNEMAEVISLKTIPKEKSKESSKDDGDTKEATEKVTIIPQKEIYSKLDKENKRKVLHLSHIPKTPKLKAMDAVPPYVASKKSEPKKETAKTIEKAKLAAAAKKKPLSQTVKSSSGGRYWLQLGAFREKSSLNSAWKKIKKKFPTTLGKLDNRTVAVNIAGKGVFYRLHAGPFSNKSTAASMCRNISTKGQACIVKTR